MCTLRLRVVGIYLFAWAVATGLAVAADSHATIYPSFSELYELVKKNLPGMSESDLNQAAVKGLLQQLAPQVRLAESGPVSEAASSLVTQTNVYDSAYGCIRVSNVGNGLASEMKEILGTIQKTNRIKGLILDLRFGGGQDYSEAAKTADLFLTNAMPLLQWEGRPVLSTAKATAFRLPTMVLINKETSGAAEALAAILQEVDVALLIGTPSAGRAASYKEFALSNGQKVQIAASPLIVGESHTLTRDGLHPDIRVDVSAEDEKAYFKDAYKTLASNLAVKSGSSLMTTSTNRSARSRINEAELVRMQREGITPDDEFVASAAAGPVAPALQDPALVRALDLLKALALRAVRQP